MRQGLVRETASLLLSQVTDDPEGGSRWEQLREKGAGCRSLWVKNKAASWTWASPEVQGGVTGLGREPALEALYRGGVKWTEGATPAHGTQRVPELEAEVNSVLRRTKEVPAATTAPT